MKNPERIVPPEEARELFKQMHEVVEENLVVEDTPEAKIIRPKLFRSGAGAQHAWEKEKEKKEDEQRERRKAA